MKIEEFINKKRFLVLTVVILVTAFILRVYKINSNFVFVYDQGRDALVIQDILKGKLTLIGPTTGIPGFFLGPFYYYLILPFYWIGGGSPIVPIIFLSFLAILGLFISALILKKRKKWIAFFSCLLLGAFNFSFIKHSRWLSNPNPILFLAPVYFFLIKLLLQDKKKSNLVSKSKIYALAGLILGLLLQTELANAMFFIPITLLIFLIRREKPSFIDITNFILSFLLTLIPIIFFNLRHDFIMLVSLKAYFADRGQKVPLMQILKERPVYYYDTLGFFFSPKVKMVFLISLILIVGYLLIKKFWRNDCLTILSIWFFLPLILMLFYNSNRGAIWEYYLISQPIPFIMLFSLMIEEFWINLKGFLKVPGRILLFGFVFLIISVNLREWKILQSSEANRISLGTMKKTVDYIYHQADGKPFNVEVFVPNFLPQAYQYLFQWYGKEKYHYLPEEDDNRQRLFFYIMEPGQAYKDGDQYWRRQWYDKRKHSGKIIKEEKIGDIDIEMRKRLSL